MSDIKSFDATQPQEHTQEQSCAYFLISKGEPILKVTTEEAKAEIAECLESNVFFQAGQISSFHHFVIESGDSYLDAVARLRGQEDLAILNPMEQYLLDVQEKEDVILLNKDKGIPLQYKRSYQLKGVSSVTQEIAEIYLQEILVIMASEAPTEAMLKLFDLEWLPVED